MAAVEKDVAHLVHH